MASVIAATLSTGDHVGQPVFMRWKQVLAFAGYSFYFSVGCGLIWAFMAVTGGGLYTYLLGAATLLCIAATAVALPFAGFLYVWGRLFPKSRLIDNTFEVLSEVGKGLDAAADFVQSTAGDSQRARESTPDNTASVAENSTQAGERDPDLPGFALPQHSQETRSTNDDADLDRWVTETRAWIAKGGTYRFRPNISTAACLCVLVIFFPGLLILLGLAFGDAFLTGAGVIVALVPVAGIAFLFAYRRNASLYVNQQEIGRTGLRGTTVAHCLRNDFGGIRLKMGSYDRWWGSTTEPEGTWDDNVMYVLHRDGRISFKVTLQVWTPDQATLLARLAR